MLSKRSLISKVILTTMVTGVNAFAQNMEGDATAQLCANFKSLAARITFFEAANVSEEEIAGIARALERGANPNAQCELDTFLYSGPTYYYTELRVTPLWILMSSALQDGQGEELRSKHLRLFELLLSSGASPYSQRDSFVYHSTSTSLANVRRVESVFDWMQYLLIDENYDYLSVFLKFRTADIDRVYTANFIDANQSPAFVVGNFFDLAMRRINFSKRNDPHFSSLRVLELLLKNGVKQESAGTALWNIHQRNLNALETLDASYQSFFGEKDPNIYDEFRELIEQYATTEN